LTEICNFIDIISIEEIDDKEDVFDITVEDNHNFFANGMVVHNCIGGPFANRVMRGQAMGKSDADIQRELLNLSDRFVDAVGRDNFNLEIQFNKLQAQHDVNRHLMMLAKNHNLNMVATCDSHYPTPDKWKTRELYKKLAWMGAKDAPKPLPSFEELKCELYPKNADQMWAEYLRHKPEHSFYDDDEMIVNAIERTHDIAWQQCDDVWIDTKVKLPTHKFNDESPFQHLVSLAKERLAAEGLDDNPVYVERLKEELSDIKHLGHESYFLTMYDVFKRAEKKTLLGPGRGSAAGSLLNFLLGITQVNPIPYGLLWGRFLGRWRVSYPDIDTDAADRDVLIDAARELYGSDAVIPVSNFNTLKLKSLVKDISKFFNVPFDEVNAVTNPLQDEVEPHARDEDQEKSVFVLKHDDCMKFSPTYRAFMEKYPDVEEHVNALFMENRSIGRHAGGVLIANARDLEKTMPIIAARGELQTPWTEGMNFRNLEDNGFLKFDFLGLTLLKDVENCIARILRKKGNSNPTFADVKSFFDEHMNCRYHKLDDKKVFEHVYHSRRKTGVFQFTNEGARKLCEEARPSSIEEISAITAIYRPGPLKANVHKKYIKAREEFNSGHMKFDHPIIEEILGPTAGFLIYQEQFMELARRLGGFTNAESDQLRKTLVKKSLDTLGKKGSEKEQAKQKFIEGAQRLHGLNPKITEPLWQTIDFMSVYCFNKSHSVSYAIDSYYAAWLHTHYEKEWLATILQSETGKPDALAKAISEIKQIGYKFAQVDINYSGTEWLYSEDLQAFVAPLTSVKGLGEAAVTEIFEYRPYKSLDDLLYDSDGEWRHSKMNKSCFESLIKVEGLGSLKEFQTGTLTNHRQLYEFIITGNDTVKRGRAGMTKTAAKKYMKEHGRVPNVFRDVLPTLHDVEDWTRPEKIAHSVEILSIAPEVLLFPPTILERIKKSRVDSLIDIAPGTAGIGWFCTTAILKKASKKGKTFYQFDILDDKNRTSRLRVWGQFKREPLPFTLWIAEAEKDPSWGLSTNAAKMRSFDV